MMSFSASLISGYSARRWWHIPAENPSSGRGSLASKGIAHEGLGPVGKWPSSLLQESKAFLAAGSDHESM